MGVEGGGIKKTGWKGMHEKVSLTFNRLVMVLMEHDGVDDGANDLMYLL